MAELESQSRAHAKGEPLKKEIFPHQIAFNVFSHNTAIAANGYNEEENKVIEERERFSTSRNCPSWQPASACRCSVRTANRS